MTVDVKLKIRVKVKPNAKRSEVAGVNKETDLLEVQLQAPPIENLANLELVRVLAEFLNIPKSRITLKSGKKSRMKTLELCGVSESELRDRLARL